MPHEQAIPSTTVHYSVLDEWYALNPPQCRWQEDADGNWDTACGETWTMIDGTPSENHYRFCPGCGKGLLELRYVEPEEKDSWQ